MRPPCYHFPALKKIEYRETCPISDSSRKMMDLLQNFVIFEKIMTYELQSFRNSSTLYYLNSEGSYFWSLKLMWCLAVILNILSLFDVKIVGYQTLGETNHSVHFCMGFIQFFMVVYSIICLVSWITLRYFNKQFIEEESFKIINPKKSVDHPWWSFKIAILNSFFRVPTVIAMIVHISCGFIGLTWRTYGHLFYVFHLFTILYISKTAKDVTGAITKYFSKILFTFMLMIIVTLFFTLIIMTFFHNDEWLLHKGVDCTNLHDCLLYTFNLGLRMGGGIGSMFVISSPDDWRTFIGKWIVEMLFFFLIKLMFLNVIFSIIVGTFGILRAMTERRESDIANVCFVCGSSRIEFSKLGKCFDGHRKEHDPWSYVYYLYYLKEKSEVEYNGLEQAIWDMYLQLKIGWLPIGSTVFLSNDKKYCPIKALHDKMDGLIKDNKQAIEENKALKDDI